MQITWWKIEKTPEICLKFKTDEAITWLKKEVELCVYVNSFIVKITVIIF